MHTKAPHEQFYRYVIPAMASQLLTGFFIIVDGFFIGQSIGDVGLASINILWPIAAVILATGLGIGSGGSVVMTHAMGAGDTEKALAARGNTLLCLGAATVLLTAALVAQVYTNDIFTAYVFLEIMTLAACALIAIRKRGRTLVAATRYMIMNLIGSGLFLLGIILLYDLTGHLLMSNMKEAVAALAKSGQYQVPLTVVVALISIGLSIKSALFPFHTWVPDAYAYSTPTSAAVLSSLVSKGYIFLLMKIMYRVIGLDVIVSTGIQDVLFVFALVGMVMGSISAIRQTDIRRMIAFSSVAQIGYVFMGIGLGTDEGMMAATFHIFSHAVCKSMLFLAAGGLADASNNSKKFRDLRGAGFRSPIAGVAFTIGALSMVGFPFLGGFASKLNFALAAMDVGGARTMLVLITLAISTWLNTLYFLRTVITLYRKPVPGAVYSVARGQRGFCFNASLVAFSIVNVALGLFAQTFVSAITAGLATFG